MLNILSKIETARCCFVNKTSQMQQKDWKGENSDCDYNDAIFIYNNLKAAERSVLTSQNAESLWDLSDLVISTPTVFAIEILADGSQITYKQPASYATVAALIAAVVAQINAQGTFTAVSSGTTIYISSTDPATIGLALELNIIEPYVIKNETNDGTYIYSMVLTASFVGQSTVYNPLDGLAWVLGAGGFAGDSAISFVNINTLTEDDYIEYPAYQNFAPNAMPAGVFNEANNKIYTTGFDGTDLNLVSIDADPDSATYKQVLTSVILTNITDIHSLLFNPENNLLYVKCADNISTTHIIIISSTDVVQADLSLAADAAHSIFGVNRRFAMDYDRASKNVFLTTNRRVIVVDGEPTSGTYNTVIFEYVLPLGNFDYGGSIIWNNGTYLVNIYDTLFPWLSDSLYEMDTSGNFTLKLAAVGITNINIANGYLIINFRDDNNIANSPLNKVSVYNLSTFTEIYSIGTTAAVTSTASAEQSDQTRLIYPINSTNKFIVFEGTTITYSYALTFAAPTSGTTCFTQAQQDALINNLLEACGCGDCNEEGSFTDEPTYILAGNSPGDFISANGDPILIT